MPIGDLNKLISIIGTTRVSDGMGGFTQTDSTIASDIWAAIWPVSASEQVQAMSTTMTISHRIRIRYRSVLRPSWRLKFGEKFYNIISIINPNMKNEYLDILAKEVA